MHHLVGLLVGTIEVVHGGVFRDRMAVNGQALRLNSRRLHGMMHAFAHAVFGNGVDGAHAHGP